MDNRKCGRHALHAALKGFSNSQWLRKTARMAFPSAPRRAQVMRRAAAALNTAFTWTTCYNLDVAGRSRQQAASVYLEETALTAPRAHATPDAPVTLRSWEFPWWLWIRVTGLDHAPKTVMLNVLMLYMYECWKICIQMLCIHCQLVHSHSKWHTFIVVDKCYSAY